MIFTLAGLMLSLSHDAETSLNSACQIRMRMHGSVTQLEAMADPAEWPRGRYALTVRVLQGSNTSISQQAGEFSLKSAQDPAILSATSHYVAPGGTLYAHLRLSDGRREAECFLKQPPDETL